MRCAGPGQLAMALRDVRAQTLQALAAWERGLGDASMAVPYDAQFNPPRWEFGHVGWFQEFWIGRNPERERGIDADPSAERPPPRLPQADRWFDSSRVEHRSRWALPLPEAAVLRDYLDRTLDESVRILQRPGLCRDAALHGEAYFGWLALVHEQMHLEAARYMSNALGVAPDPATPSRPAAARPGTASAAASVSCGPACHAQGSAAGGFVFDNELGQHEVSVAAFEIDAAPVSNEAFARFVDAGGYADRASWTDEGWSWRSAAGAAHPRFWRRGPEGWQQRWFGRWLSLDPAAPVCNVNAHEAQAWCRWAGRRLPAEAEWEFAATAAPAAPGFAWGQVWEWTATAFGPYPGFVAHPYRDYSQPWFDSRRVLRGASFATHPQIVDARYRNFFTPERNDIFAGFRSCAPAG